jgi:hypothetical protein
VQQTGGTKLFADERSTHRNLLCNFRLAGQYTDSSVKVYEEPFLRLS